MSQDLRQRIVRGVAQGSSAQQAAQRFEVRPPAARARGQRIVRGVAQGSSAQQAAQRFEVSPSAAVKLMQRVRQTGSTAPDKIGGVFRAYLVQMLAPALQPCDVVVM